MVERKYKRWFSWILIVALLIPEAGNFWKSPVSRKASAADDAVSYRNVIYPLDENNKDVQGIYYHILSDAQPCVSVGSTEGVGTAAYQGVGDGIVTIPDAVSKDGVIYDVREIAPYAFERCSALKEITLGDNVERIAYGAFSSSGLRKIHFGKQLKEIVFRWTGAFSGTALKEITIDQENTAYKVQDGVLFNADMTELLRYPSLDSRTEYVIPDSVKKIELEAFEKTKNLKNVVIPSGVEEIGNAAFREAACLAPEQDLRHVKKLGAFAFSYTENLKTFLLGENLSIYKETGNASCNAFGYSELETIYFPSGVRADSDMLREASKLRTAVFEKGIVLHEQDLRSCKALEIAILPEDLTEIPKYFAGNCPSLKKIYIPETVTKIGDNAFQDDTVVLYGKKDSVVESYAEKMGLTFEDIDEHVHQYEPYSFYEDEYVKITGMLCQECGHAYSCEQSLIKPLPGTNGVSFPPAVPSASVLPASSPSESQNPAVTPVSSPSGSQNPGITPGRQTPSPSREPWQFPTVSPRQSVMPSAFPVTTSPASEKTKSSPVVSPVTSTPEVRTQKSLYVNNFYVTSTDNYKVRISWTENQYADGYRLYLAEGKNGRYRLLRRFGKDRTTFTYRKQKAGVFYRYKLQAQKKENGSIVYGAFTAPKTIMISRLVTPSVSVKKKMAGNIPYLQICVKKTNADKVQMYVSTNNKSYQVIHLRENSIRKLHGIYRIRYKQGKRDFRIRLRTYKKLRGKTVYSYYSKVVRIYT